MYVGTCNKMDIIRYILSTSLYVFCSTSTYSGINVNVFVTKFSWSVDSVCPHQHRLHEPAHEGAGGSHHQSQEALQARAQPSHQQVSS